VGRDSPTKNLGRDSFMTEFVVLSFVVTYLGMALGRVPGLRIDRAGIAMIVAVGLVAVGAVPVDAVDDAIQNIMIGQAGQIWF